MSADGAGERWEKKEWPRFQNSAFPWAIWVPARNCFIAYDMNEADADAILAAHAQAQRVEELQQRVRELEAKGWELLATVQGSGFFKYADGEDFGEVKRFAALRAPGPEVKTNG